MYAIFIVNKEFKPNNILLQSKTFFLKSEYYLKQCELFSHHHTLTIKKLNLFYE